MSALSLVGWQQINKESLSKLTITRDVDKIIVFHPEDPEFWPLFQNPIDFKKIVTEYKDKGITFELVTGASLKYPNKSINNYKIENLKSWETFWFFCVIHNVVTYNKIPLNHNPDITKLFISLNHRPQDHRCLLIDTMSKHDLIKDNYISWHYTRNLPYNFKHWTPKVLTLDAVSEETPNHIVSFDGMTVPKQFRDSLWSIVPETTHYSIFMTEKTILPIYHRRPFLVFSAPYFHKHLRELGFELFDELIDYSFDSIEDMNERCERFVLEIKKISNLNIMEMHEIVKPKVNNNYFRLLELVKNREGIPDIDTSSLSLNTSWNFFNDIANIGTHENFNRLYQL